METVKIKLTIDVPKNNCEECQFRRYHSEEVGYQSYNDWYTCSLFQCKLDDNKRCIACKSLEAD